MYISLTEIILFGIRLHADIIEQFRVTACISPSHHIFYARKCLFPRCVLCNVLCLRIKYWTDDSRVLICPIFHTNRREPPMKTKARKPKRSLKVCLRCSHEWLSAKERPAQCPKCKQPAWDKLARGSKLNGRSPLKSKQDSVFDQMGKIGKV